MIVSGFRQKKEIIHYVVEETLYLCNVQWAESHVLTSRKKKPQRQRRKLNWLHTCVPWLLRSAEAPQDFCRSTKNWFFRVPGARRNGRRRDDGTTARKAQIWLIAPKHGGETYVGHQSWELVASRTKAGWEMTIKKAKNDFRLWSWVRPEPSEAQRPVRYVAALWIFFSHVTSSGIPPPPPPPCCVPRYAPPELLLRYLWAESTHRSTTEHSVSRKELNHEVGRIRNFSSVFFNAWVSSHLDTFFFFFTASR